MDGANARLGAWASLDRQGEPWEALHGIALWSEFSGETWHRGRCAGRARARSRGPEPAVVFVPKGEHWQWMKKEKEVGRPSLGYTDDGIRTWREREEQKKITE